MNKDYILGVFKDEESLVAAFDKVKEKGVLPLEVFTPYPVHEILHGMGNKTRITYAAFFLRIVCSNRNTCFFNLGGNIKLANELWRKTG